MGVSKWASDDVIDSAPRDWPPIQEPWRCLQSGNAEEFEMAIAELNGYRDNRDCPIVTPEICTSADFFAVPCESLGELNTEPPFNM